MRTEWFIGFAAVILIIIAGVVAIDLREDDPQAVESPAATSTPTTAPTEPAATETATQNPMPSPTGTDTPTQAPSPAPEPTSTAAPSPQPTTTSTTTPVDLGDDASPVTRADLTITSAGSRFSSAGAASRQSAFKQDCPVVPVNNETFTQCRKGYSYAQQMWWAVTEVADGPGHVATVWRHTDGGPFRRVLETGTYNEAMTLGGPSWPNHDAVMSLDFGSSLEVVTWDTGTSPRVAGRVSLDGGASFDLLAQQVFVATSGANRTTTVLDIKGGGALTGKRTMLSKANDRSPEEVALLAYRAWVSKNRAAAAPYVNDAVDEALFVASPNQGGDLFSLQGTSCPLEDGTFTCTFNSSAGTMHWSIRSLNGELRVVAIDSTA